MASYNAAATTASDLRYLGVLKQSDSSSASSDPRSNNLDDFDESDVVWSFFPSPGSYSNSNSPSPPPVHRRRRLNHRQSGLSAAFDENGQCHLIGRKSMAIPTGARSEDVRTNFHRSAPVNVPVWPKAYRDSEDLDEMENFEEEEEMEEENGEMVPPHVIVSKSHVTFSVFEGVGRTLKGRDLCRVRNAVFQNTGFID